ncbi:hypothetical protein KP509_34G055400 [Ceratopteris richardii]|uniref:F-box protein n=1 Tax=Ceratopteris richardii TaxID=49495 RepID=A0A8T2QKM7_CERRI|nr:hypothetical protein KP509_34G055400 [Ceratopteris richardii]
MENFHSHPIPVHKPYPNTQTAADVLVEVLLGAQDLSSQLSHALEQALSRRPDVEKVDLLRRSVLLGTQLKNAASRLWREYDTSCNSINWPLSHDLTIKIFSQVGIYSLSQAAASCNLFKKVAMESACYREIDLTDQNLRVNNSTVAKLIKRAGQCLRSLKLGSPTNGNKEDHATCPFDSAWTAVSGNIFLTKSCLEPLFVSGGAVGLLLQTLHLQNIVELDSRNVCKAIAACPGLMDLQIIGLHINERKVLRSVSMFCHKLTHLCLESPRPDFSSSWLSYSMRTVSCSELVNGCPNISSLSLRGFKLPDQKVKLLLKGLRHLSEADFSGADMLTGLFLRDLASSSGQKLRSLKLCDCSHLRAVISK